MKRSWHLLLSFVFLACSPAFAAAADEAKVDPLDWPYWRGPEGNSISRETGLPDTINLKGGAGSNLLWKKEGAAGRGTPPRGTGTPGAAGRSLQDDPSRHPKSTDHSPRTPPSGRLSPGPAAPHDPGAPHKPG